MKFTLALDGNSGRTTSASKNEGEADDDENEDNSDGGSSTRATFSSNPQFAIGLSGPSTRTPTPELAPSTAGREISASPEGGQAVTDEYANRMSRKREGQLSGANNNKRLKHVMCSSDPQLAVGFSGLSIPTMPTPELSLTTMARKMPASEGGQAVNDDAFATRVARKREEVLDGSTNNKRLKEDCQVNADCSEAILEIVWKYLHLPRCCQRV